MGADAPSAKPEAAEGGKEKGGKLKEWFQGLRKKEGESGAPTTGSAPAEPPKDEKGRTEATEAERKTAAERELDKDLAADQPAGDAGKAAVDASKPPETASAQAPASPETDKATQEAAEAEAKKLAEAAKASGEAPSEDQVQAAAANAANAAGEAVNASGEVPPEKPNGLLAYIESIFKDLIKTLEGLLVSLGIKSAETPPAANPETPASAPANPEQAEAQASNGETPPNGEAPPAAEKQEPEAPIVNEKDKAFSEAAKQQEVPEGLLRALTGQYTVSGQLKLPEWIPDRAARFTRQLPQESLLRGKGMEDPVFVTHLLAYSLKWTADKFELDLNQEASTQQAIIAMKLGPDVYRRYKLSGEGEDRLKNRDIPDSYASVEEFQKALNDEAKATYQNSQELARAIAAKPKETPPVTSTTAPAASAEPAPNS